MTRRLALRIALTAAALATAWFGSQHLDALPLPWEPDAFELPDVELDYLDLRPVGRPGR